MVFVFVRKNKRVSYDEYCDMVTYRYVNYRNSFGGTFQLNVVDCVQQSERNKKLVILHV